MNPREQLTRLAQSRSIPAVLRRKSGEELTIVAQPVETTAEPIASPYVQATPLKKWGVAIEDLTTARGVVFPDSGDQLVVEGRVYLVTRNSQTARAWQWAYERPGSRIFFWTKETT